MHNETRLPSGNRNAYLARKQALEEYIFTPRGPTHDATCPTLGSKVQAAVQASQQQQIAHVRKLLVQLPQLPLQAATSKALRTSDHSVHTSVDVSFRQPLARHPLVAPLDLTSCHQYPEQSAAPGSGSRVGANGPCSPARCTQAYCRTTASSESQPCSWRKSLGGVLPRPAQPDPLSERPSARPRNNAGAAAEAAWPSSNPYTSTTATRPALEALAATARHGGGLLSGTLQVATTHLLEVHVPLPSTAEGQVDASPSNSPSSRADQDTLPQLLYERPTGRRKAQLLVSWVETHVRQLVDNASPEGAGQVDASAPAGYQTAHSSSPQRTLDQSLAPVQTDEATVAELQSLLPELTSLTQLSLAWAAGSVTGADRILGVLAAGMSGLAQQVAGYCLEHGALCAFLFNTACGLLVHQRDSLQHDKHALLEAHAGARKGVKRMERTLDWVVETRHESKELRTENEQLQTRLHLLEGLCNDCQQDNIRLEEQTATRLVTADAEQRKSLAEMEQRMLRKDNVLKALKADRDQLAESVSEAAAVVEEAAGGLVQLGRMLLGLLDLPEDTVFEDMADGQPEKAVVMLVQQLSNLLESLSSRSSGAEDEHLRRDEHLSRLEAEEEGFQGPGTFSLGSLAIRSAGAGPASKLSSLVAAWKCKSGVAGLVAGLRRASAVSAGAQVDLDPELEEADASLNSPRTNAKPALSSSGRTRHAVALTIRVEEPVYLTLSVAASLAADASTAACVAALEAKVAQLQAAMAVQEAALQRESRKNKELLRSMQEQQRLLQQESQQEQLDMRGTGGTSTSGHEAPIQTGTPSLPDAVEPTTPSSHASLPASSGKAKPHRPHSVKILEVGDTEADAEARSPSEPASRNRMAGVSLHSLVSQVTGRRLSSKESEIDTPRHMVAHDARLREAVIKYSDVKPRSMEWLLKLVDTLYKTKCLKDEQGDKAGMPRCSLPEHMFTFLFATYGAKSLVNEYASCIMVTLAKYVNQDLRLKVFQQFIREDWDTAVLTTFLAATQQLAAPAQVPCIEFPPDHVLRRGASNLVCVHKCIAVADRMLGERSVATCHAFAARIVQLAVGVAEEGEEEIYRVQPEGMDARDVAAAVTAQHVTHGLFHKIESIVFLNELCLEYIRCETQLVEVLPALVQVYDADLNGLMERSELHAMLRKMTGREDLREADMVWQTAVAAEMSGSDHGKQPAQVGMRAAVEALRKSDVVRRFVRLHHTAPAAFAEGNSKASDERKASLLLLLARHWRDYEAAFSTCINQAGQQALFIQEQVSKMKKEGVLDRKAVLFCNVLEGLFNSRLNNFKRCCSSAAASSPDPTQVQDMLEALTNATKASGDWPVLGSFCCAQVGDPFLGTVLMGCALGTCRSRSGAHVWWTTGVFKQNGVQNQTTLTYLAASTLQLPINWLSITDSDATSKCLLKPTSSNATGGGRPPDEERESALPLELSVGL